MDTFYVTGRTIAGARRAETTLRHVVSRNEDGEWVTTCDQNPKPAVRDYRGYRSTITCPRCLAAIKADEEVA